MYRRVPILPQKLNAMYEQNIEDSYSVVQTLNSYIKNRLHVRELFHSCILWEERGSTTTEDIEEDLEPPISEGISEEWEPPTSDDFWDESEPPTREDKKDKRLVDYVWRHAEAQNYDFMGFFNEDFYPCAQMLMNFIGYGYWEKVKFFLKYGLPIKLPLEYFEKYVRNGSVFRTRSHFPVSAVACHALISAVGLPESEKKRAARIMKSFDIYMTGIKEPFPSLGELRYYAERILKKDDWMVKEMFEVYLSYFPQMAERSPRSLNHLCRCSIREHYIDKSHRNFPDDIPCSTLLRSYINLELEYPD